MTENDLNTAIASGNTNMVTPPTSPTPPPASPDSSGQYIPVLESIRPPRPSLNAAPTTTPKTFPDQFEFEDDGSVKSLWVYINNTWVQFKPQSAMSRVQVYMAASNLTMSGLTQVTFDTKNFDTLNEFALGAAFTAQATGYYWIATQVTFTPSGTPTLGVQIKNSFGGNVLSQAQVKGSSLSGYTVSSQVLTGLNAGDTVIVNAQDSGNNVVLGGAAQQTYLSIFRLN